MIWKKAMAHSTTRFRRDAASAIHPHTTASNRPAPDGKFNALVINMPISTTRGAIRWISTDRRDQIIVMA